MVLERILNVLKEELREEIEGASKYMELASMADMAGFPRMQKYLMDIAHDEFTHADFIFTTLKKNGIDISHDPDTSSLPVLLPVASFGTAA